MYREYDELLNCSFLPDYWSDEGVSHAVSLLEEFDENDWNELKDECLNKEEEWQVKCAETLSEVEHQNVVLILEIFLDSDWLAVKVSAADALNSLCQDYGKNFLDGFNITKIKNLESIVDSLGKVDAIAVKSLLSKL